MLARVLPWLWVVVASAGIAAVFDLMQDQPPLTMAVAGVLGLLVVGIAQRRAALGGGAVLLIGLTLPLLPSLVDGHILSQPDAPSLLRLSALFARVEVAGGAR